ELDLAHLRLSRLFGINLWLGGKTKSGMHFDNADNLFGQIYGRKSAMLVDPQYSKFLYQFADSPSKSAVNPEEPDFNVHPLYARCEVWNASLEPGDGLFIPYGWWHYIAAEDISISLNCWHGDTLSDFERTKQFVNGGARVV